MNVLHPWRTPSLPPANAPSPRLAPDHPDAGLLEELEVEPDRVAPAADACDKLVGKPSLAGQDLLLRLSPDDVVEVADHLRIGPRAVHRSEDVMGAPDIGDPIAHRLVDGFLEGPLAGLEEAINEAMRDWVTN